MDHLVLHGGHVRPVEGALPGGRVHEDRAQREDVRRRAHALPQDLLGGAVPGGDGHLAGGGERQAVLGAGDAEVDDPRPGRGEHDVGRLQVAVDQSRRVDVAQGVGQRGGQRAHPGGVERAVRAYRLVEGGAGEELGRDPGAVALALGAQDPGDLAPVTARAVWASRRKRCTRFWSCASSGSSTFTAAVAPVWSRPK